MHLSPLYFNEKKTIALAMKELTKNFLLTSIKSLDSILH